MENEMGYEQKRHQISDMIYAIGDTVKILSPTPSTLECRMIIHNLYQVMREISDWEEMNGY